MAIEMAMVMGHICKSNHRPAPSDPLTHPPSHATIHPSRRTTTTRKPLSMPPAAPLTPPTAPIVILDIAFDIRVPYSVGHVMTAAEAEALNTARTERIRNNFAKALKRRSADGRATGAWTEEELASIRADFAAYDAAYDINAVRTPTASALDRECRRIGEIVVRERANRRGVSEHDISRDEWHEAVAAASTIPAVRAEAQRRLDAMSAVAREALGEGGGAATARGAPI